MSDAAPATTPVATPAVVSDAPAEAPKAPRAGSRKDMIKAAVMAMPPGAMDDDDAPPAPVEAPAVETPPAVEAAPPPVETPPEPQKGKAQAWADVMERERKIADERRQVKLERESLKEEREARELMKTNPLEWVKKYGGPDFGKRFVAHTINDGKAPPEEHIEALKGEVAQMREQLAAKDQQARIDEYIGEHKAHWRADNDDAKLLSGWYDDSEVAQVVHQTANTFAQQTGRALTPAELTGTVSGELRHRLERLSKSDAGQQYLRSLLKAEPTPPTPVPTKQRAPAMAPKTLSQDLNAQGSTPDLGRLRPRSERQKILVEALSKMPQE